MIDLSVIRDWYKESQDEVPRLRDDVVLCKMPSFVILVELTHGEKKTLLPVEAAILALCNGKFTIREMCSIWQKSFPDSMENCLYQMGNAFHEYKAFLVTENQKRLDDNRYNAADFLYNALPVQEDYTTPYPYPIEAVFAITNKCNMRCIYCYRAAGPSWKNELSTGEIMDAIDQSADMGVVRADITGGEPLAHPDVIKILDKCIRRNIFPYMSTNGSLVTRDTVLRLRDIGMKDIQISLDTVVAATFEKMVGAGIDVNSVVRAIDLFVKEGFQVFVKSVITRLNIGETRNLIDSCAGLGVTRLSMEGFEISVGGRGDKSLLASEDEIARLKKLIYKKRSQYRGKIELEGYNRAAPWKNRKDIITCGGMVNAFVLQPDGNIALCENLGNIPELVFGNIREQPLKNIWASEKVMKFLNPEPSSVSVLCSHCPDLPACRTGCYNRSLIKTGRLWEPDPLCWRIKKGHSTTLSKSQPAYVN